MSEFYKNNPAEEPKRQSTCEYMVERHGIIFGISTDRLRELAEDEAKGRTTGFPDRNGTIIRERDIVRVTFLDRFAGKEYLREDCEVIFAKGAFGFMWGNEKSFCTLCSFCVGTVVFYEIIGHAERAIAAADDTTGKVDHIVNANKKVKEDAEKESHNPQECKNCDVDRDSHKSYLICIKHHGGIDRDPSICDGCADFRKR